MYNVYSMSYYLEWFVSWTTNEEVPGSNLSVSFFPFFALVKNSKHNVHKYQVSISCSIEMPCSFCAGNDLYLSPTRF